MTERVDFYVLKSAAAKQRWAFACRLTEKAYLKDLKIVIVNETLADARALDDLLWTFNERSFVPHKICLDEQSVDPATPVHLALESSPLPPADLLVNLAQRLPAQLERYARVAEIIDADEERRRLGRERFKAYRESEAHDGDASDQRLRGWLRRRMDKAYSPADIEARLYARWEASGYFSPGGKGAPYSIVIPPPNVTGTLHMGHAFQDTIMDALIRFHRMRGFDTLWQPGTDHAGIATQMVVERQLNAAGESRMDLGREAFVARVWQWKETSGGMIAKQMRRLGASVDWQRDVFTLDPKLSQAVTEVFVRLYEEGLIYRGKRLVNWDPVLKTALSDLEVVAEEENGSLWHLRYPLSEASGYLVVATTRPETLFGDAAVAVHPDDERYRHLVGHKVRLPLTDRELPIIADSYVDPAFGSGCVKITPAHDFNDYEVGQRHDLPLINVMTLDAALNDGVPRAYRGLDRVDARKRVIADLDGLGLIERIEPHKLTVPRGDRSNAVLEPLLTDQWFVDIKPLAAPALRAVEEGRVRFVPETWTGVYYDWMHKIKDWCISRQLWWGHRIPAWYDPDGRWYVGRSEAEVRSAHGVDPRIPLRQDDDVLDTWFSSALWPFSTQGWPEKTPRIADLLSHRGAGDGIRHHLFLGGPHDHDGAEVRGRCALPHRVHARADPRSGRPENVQVQGQCHRPAGHR